MAFSKKTSDGIAEVFINVILSNPLTHMRNGLGNWISQAMVQAEKKYAATFFKKLGAEGTGTNYMAAHSDIARSWGKHMAAKEIMSAMADVYKISGSKIESKNISQRCNSRWLFCKSNLNSLAHQAHQEFHH